MSVEQPMKRRRSEESISPPPTKRKALPSTTTQKAVASFFTPLSKKAPEKLRWSERARENGQPRTLLVGMYGDCVDSAMSGESRQMKRIATFDLDGTLITTISASKFARSSTDWKWWHPCVPQRLRELHQEGYSIAIMSNQGGVVLQDEKKSKTNFTAKLGFVLEQLDIPIVLYAATADDDFRKPRIGMWDELVKDLEARHILVDLKNSFYVGDAAGRIASAQRRVDFSCSDRNLAANIGLAFFTPEEYFLEESPAEFARNFDVNIYLDDTARDDSLGVKLINAGQEIMIFCGSPGAGKSTTYWKYFEPRGYERVNQDILKSRDRCVKVAQECLAKGKSVAVDNTNRDQAVRKVWVDLARANNVPIRCLVFSAEISLCRHNDAVRALNTEMNPEGRKILPASAFFGFARSFQRPELSEGFEDIIEVPFQFQGSEAQKQIWIRHWT